MEEKLTINEIFYSIQGESTHTGRPCIFIRLSFCNLRCSWCDTAYSFYEGREQTIGDVLAAIRTYPCKLVEVTGGEPLAQEACLPLLERLSDEGYEVLLETSGSIDISHVDPRVRRIIDIKCPGSGMADRNLWKNMEHLRAGDEVKFVVKDRDDYEWALARIRQFELAGKAPLLMSPVHDVLNLRELAGWMLKDGLNARMQIQLHKLIWEPSTRGV